MKKMDRGRLLTTLATLAALVPLGGCYHHARQTLRIGGEVSPPAGLDSVGTAKWIDAQRAACPGRLRFLVDEMPIVQLDGGPATYHSFIVAVQCTAGAP
jgi:hypothetical protein